jgi:ABC-type branched-subunit amino acid transport system substrate-binding protein
MRARMMKKTCSLANLVVACVACAFAVGLYSLVLAADGFAPDYSAQIAPIFQQKCLTCHSKATQMGGLVVDSYEAVMKGGDHGRMIVPGKAEESLMVQMLEGKVQPLMPFGADPVSPSTIAVIKAWVDAGAKGPAASDVATALAAAKVASAKPQVPGVEANSQQPYAKIDREAIAYAGPDRAIALDLKGPEVRIGLLVPLGGPRKAEGEVVVLAARLALEDQPSKLLGGQQLALAIGDESGPWGRASREIARLVTDDDAIVIVTSTDGGATHLAEQIGNRIGVPVLTLSSDSTTTQINLPWIFRLAADDRPQAESLARAIYLERKYHRVMLVVERDHDGRLGAEEFEKASARLGAPAPDRLELDPASFDPDQASAAIESRNPEAVVLWTGTAVANQLARTLRQSGRALPLFVCQKAAGAGAGLGAGSGLWTVSRRGASTAAGARFAARFEALTGKVPTPEAEASYDAVCLIASALQRAGPNRARLRDQLSKVSDWTGISGQVSFDGAGNNLAPVAIVPLQ